MAYTKQVFISHSSGGWKVWDQQASMCEFWWGPTSWLVNGYHLALSSHGRGDGRWGEEEGAHWSLFLRALIPSWSLLSLFPLFPHLFAIKCMGPDAMILVFQMLSFKPAFSVISFASIKRLFSSSLLSAIMVVSALYQLKSAIGILMSPPSWTPHPIPPLYVLTEHQVELPESYSKFPLAIHFINAYSNTYVSMLLSPFIPPDPSLAVSTSLFFMSVSLLLPYKQVHQDHLSGLSRWC